MNTDTTSLFTDIVGATELAVRIGDAAWAELLERHHAIVRAQLNALRGREMDTSGDGFFAIFADVPDALSAATAIREEVSPLRLTLRLGLHTGDCHVADSKCTGLAIHICARIVALAEPDEVLVSQAVYDAAGPKFHFVDRGTHALRGIPGEWKLYALANSS